MKEIKLSNGKITLVDDEDYEYLSQFKWCEHNRGYVQTSYGTRKDRKRAYMHRLVNKTPEGLQTDHINGNKLDNRKENLRTCTSVQNQQNIRTSSRGEVPYRGVTLDKRRSKYQARIKINGYHKHIGLFKTAEEAANAYNEYAYIHHGDFAVLNKIEPNALKHALHWDRYRKEKLM